MLNRQSAILSVAIILALMSATAPKPAISQAIEVFLPGIESSATPLVPPVIAADGTETLGPPSIPIADGTGIVAAGTGMVTQPGTINIDVPVGASVNQVLLY